MDSVLERTKSMEVQQKEPYGKSLSFNEMPILCQWTPTFSEVASKMRYNTRFIVLN